MSKDRKKPKHKKKTKHEKIEPPPSSPVKTAAELRATAAKRLEREQSAIQSRHWSTTPPNHIWMTIDGVPVKYVLRTMLVYLPADEITP